MRHHPTAIASGSRRRSGYSMAIVTTLCSLLLACGDTGASSGAPGTAGGFKRPPTPVVTAPAERQPISDIIEAIGTTVANESVTLTAKVTDTVSRVRFNDGALVESGAVLLELTNTEQAALLAEARANAEEAERQRKRLEDLYEQRTIPLSQVDEARARSNAAEARYNSLLARLDDRLIRAPFSGLLGFRQVSAGTLISPGTAIATLDDVSVVKLDFEIPEVFLAQLTPGLTLQAASPAYPEQPFDARIESIDTRIDPATRTATARALIDNPETLLRPGMLMTVELRTTAREALVIPETALVQRSGRALVYVVTDADSDAGGKMAVLRPVTIGVRLDGLAEIISGLQAGERVIVEGTIKVRDGSAVVELPASTLASPASAQPNVGA